LRGLDLFRGLRRHHRGRDGFGRGCQAQGHGQVFIAEALRGRLFRLDRGTQRVDRSNEGATTGRLHGNRLDDLHTELRFQARAIERVATIAGEIAHVQRHDHGTADAPQLEHQAERQSEVGRIDDADDQVGRFLAVKLAHDEIAGDRLIKRCGNQAVGARQIEELIVALAIHTRERAFLALDGDARIVGHFLAASGEAVE